ncbi:triose-phosphate isomerase [Candidatus Micrarchaeota archaeon CG10_big_fil_rev_8_21_14_0_10_45_29]|nr:MAG: triose-phosphate isomerase [Candidatus Micrarchaeota archaeon CG10_big_fil_rev_8_21_14_0_10_45_29]
MGKRFIALNFKAYKESEGQAGVKLCQIAKEVADSTGVRIICCPNNTLLRDAAKTGCEIFAQHVDGNSPGAHTGSITASMLNDAGVSGSLINHSEKRINHENIKVAAEALKKEGLEAMVCAKDVGECAQLAQFKPKYVAIEPPELIGSGISVSTAKPEVVTGAVHAIKEASEEVIAVCGAGVSNAQDVKKAFELGVQGVLLASAYVKSASPKTLLEEMASVL